MKQKTIFAGRGLPVLAAALASTLLATSALGQAFDGTYSGVVTSTTVVGNSTTETTGDSTVAPYENTTTTYTEETVTSTLPSSSQAVSVTVNGNTYTGTIDYSGDGGQDQIHETSITNTYDPGPPPTVTGTTVNPDVIVPGESTITAVSASGSIGNIDNYAATLSTSGPVVDGSVVATETSATVSTSGMVFATRVGTATYDPGAGEVAVALPSTPTAYTSIDANGISTSGVITANGFNANGNRITGVAAGVADTDAVNVGQLNSAIAGVNVRVDALNSSLQDLDKRANAGTAVAVAMSGGTFLPNKQINFTANIGGYRGEAAIAGQLGVLVNENVALNAGVATGFSKRGGTAWRGGVSFGF